MELELRIACYWWRPTGGALLIRQCYGVCSMRSASDSMDHQARRVSSASVDGCCSTSPGGTSIGGSGQHFRKRNLSLPEHGWGIGHIEEATPHAGADWTNSCQQRDRRQLKNRERGESRPVPVPPELTELLHRHMVEFGAGPTVDHSPASVRRSCRRSPTCERGGPLDGSRSFLRSPPGRSLRLRPAAARLCLYVAERRRTGPAGGRVGRVLGRRAAQGVRQVHRRTGRHRAAARHAGARAP
jgi:hypothetical protein